MKTIDFWLHTEQVDG